MNSENASVIAERIANSGVASHHTLEVRVMMFNATLSAIYQLYRLHILKSEKTNRIYALKIYNSYCRYILELYSVRPSLNNGICCNC